MKITGAIFDMDGTLIDSMYIWDKIIVDFAIARGITPRDSFYGDVRDLKIAAVPAYLKKEYGYSCTQKEMIDGLYAIVEELYRTVVQPKPGVIEFLEDFRRRGIRMCVATATELYVVEMVLERLDMLKYFSGLFTCTMVGAGKDKPVIYEAALKKLGTTKAETPVFEDATYAIKTAKAAGFPIVAIYDEFYKGDWETIRSLADVCIEDYRSGILL